MAFDFDHAVHVPFRMQPGLRRLADGAAQLTPNRPGARHLREKLAVLSGDPSRALQRQAAFDPAPALAALAAHAAREHPAAWAADVAVDAAVNAAGGWQARTLGWSVHGDTVAAIDSAGVPAAEARSATPEIGACLRALAPEWRAAGLLALSFAEDFAIVDGTRATLPWLAVALPSHWVPQDKIGRHFAEVHAPVADNRLLLAAGDHLMRMVTGPERWERFVWTITRHPRLNQHPAHLDPAPWPAEAAADAEAIAAQAWFRTERQTFIPVPGRAQAVFTIKVDIQPLRQALTTREEALRVHDAIATMSPDVLEYRSLTGVRERLLSWLGERGRTLADAAVESLGEHPKGAP